MATYDVHRQVGGRASAGAARLHLSARSPGEAVALARRALGAGGPDVYAVYRHGRLRRRRFVGLFAGPGGAGPDDGLAGVREPRRPLPTPPSLRAEAPDPVTRHR
jgi:hypothetical protein